MQWGFRWYGTKGDPIPIEHVKQIPGINGIVGTLLNKMPGDIWEIDEILELKKEVAEGNLELLGIESVAIHDSIKAGTKERDFYIDNYIQTIRNLGACDVRLICYSFKPIFGWFKTNMNYELPDGSTTLQFDQSVIDELEPQDLYKRIASQSKGFKISGWEEERLAKFNALVEMYDGVTEDILFDNLKYFLERIIPVCEEVDVKMGIHPDDPPWEIFDFPRITKNLADLKRIINAVDSPYNGLTFCTGALGADPNNDIPQMIREVGHRINFVHFRNVGFLGEKNFIESAHLSTEGSLDMYAIMEALVDVGFDGLLRPDHGRTVWGEVARPGYGLYDRAMGLTYIQGLHEAVTKAKKS